MRTLLLATLAALAACAPEDADTGLAFSDEALAAPNLLFVTPTAWTLTRGEAVTFDVFAASDPNRPSEIWLAATDGSPRLWCPERLGGTCLDAVGRGRLLGPFATSDGAARLTVTVPRDLPLDHLFVQAVMATGAEVSRSNVLAMPVE